MNKFIAVTILFALACAHPKGPASSYYQSIPSNTNYRLAGSGWRTTPGGVSLWDPKHQVEDAFVDKAVNHVQACAESMKPSMDELKGGFCPTGVPWLWNGFRRDLFDVVIAPDWYDSSCTAGKQVFPCWVSKSECEQARLDKPELQKCSAPCACRGTVQENRMIVVTPNLELLPGMLFSLVTGCTSMWHSPFDACTAPMTP